MTRREKRVFINELIGNVRKTILANVPNMPDNWDGHELRHYIAQKFHDADMTMNQSHYRRRKREYDNEVNVRNL